MSSNTARDLLLLLSDTQFHSGESLGLALGMSRAAIWKHIHALQSRGLNITSLHSKGYQLASPVELLDQKNIRSLLAANLKNNIELHIFDEIDSTNHYLMNGLKENQLSKNTLHVCLAETQTAGKGRRGRHWVTPYASALAISVLYPFHCSFSRLSGLSLAVGTIISKALTDLGAEDIKLKWPNDILWQDRKLAGILIELSDEVEGPCNAVIGIGINISVAAAQMDQQMQPVKQAWVDLNQITSKPVSRNQLAASFIECLSKELAQFETQGLEGFIKDWQALDYLQGREVDVEDGNRKLSGRAAGITEKGDLLLATPSGQVTISAGEVSVRAQ